MQRGSVPEDSKRLSALTDQVLGVSLKAVAQVWRALQGTSILPPLAGERQGETHTYTQSSGPLPRAAALFPGQRLPHSLVGSAVLSSKAQPWHHEN